MFFDSQSFNTLEAGVKATWLSQQLHSQNLANIETPGYKAKQLTFSEVMDGAQADFSANGKSYRYSIQSDDNTETRTDGNNVDSDVESIAMYKDYAQYTALLDKIKNQFTNYSYVLQNGPK